MYNVMKENQPQRAPFLRNKMKKLLKSQREFPKSNTSADGSMLCLYFQGVPKTSTPILTYQGGSVGAAQVFLCREGNPKSPRSVCLIPV